MTFSISDALKQGYENLPRLEAELLLAYSLQVTRSYLFAHKEEFLSSSVKENYQQLCLRREKGEPLAYLVGHKEFWSLEFEVTPDTLIPRPETEILVQTTLNKLSVIQGLSVVDLGVGSGAVAIVLAKERPCWNITGVDNSLPALAVAKRNAQRHNVQNLTLLHSEWCMHLPKREYDVIVSNPPYIAEGDQHLRDLQFEPLNALVSGKEGLDAISEIITQAKSYLRKGGLLLLEHGFNQALKVRNLLLANEYEEVESYKDLSGIERVTSGTKY